MAVTATPVYSNSANQIAALKELYSDSNEYLKDLVYKENPLLALMPKNESPDGAAGKYIPVPIQYGTGQGRSHTFSNAQDQQTAPSLASFFVYVVQDYQLVTITNLLMEQTKTSAGAFIDEAKLSIDSGFRTLTNNIAFEMYGSGTGTRGTIGTYAIAGPTVTIILANSQEVVAFEVGQLLTAAATDGGAPSADALFITKVDRSSGQLTGTSSTGGALSGVWAPGAFLAVEGDVPTAGVTNTQSMLGLSGLAAWVPSIAPTTGDNFWGVDRSIEPTRLGGLRYDASALTIEEGITNALGFVNREGARPDYAIMDFASYTALVNALGAKVVNVQVKHDTVDVAFEGIRFQSAYGIVTVLADRSCPPMTCYLLTLSTWKLRSLGKVPHILVYGMEGLEGLRVGNADALEVRIAYYGNIICSAPGMNCVVKLSS